MQYNAIPQIEKLLFLPQCITCGRSLKGESSFCFVCKRAFLQNLCKGELEALFYYEGEIKALLANFRGVQIQRSLNFFLEVLERERWIEKWQKEKFHYVVSAPQNPKKYHSGLEQLSFEIAKRLGIKYERGILKKIPHTQHGKSIHQRMNIDCFVHFSKSAPLKEAKVLLLDDVYTSGTTLEMSAYQLRKNGASEVKKFTLAVQMVKGFHTQEQEAQNESHNIEPLLAHLFM